MRMCDIDPAVDSRWNAIVRTTETATIFHTAGWLEVIKRTYGWGCRVLAVVDDRGVVTGGVPYCITDSAISGRRIVSVPFSDHCPPVCETNSELSVLLRGLRQVAYVGGADSVQLRGLASGDLARREGWRLGERFLSHTVDLSDGIDAIERRYHKDCVLRKVRRAAREGVQIERGVCRELIDQFYALLVRTRRRHGYPPPPKRWFFNVAECVPQTEYAVCFHQGTAVAGVVTLRWNDTLHYKYGASDERYHHLGAMPLLYVEMIRRATEAGARKVDLGRTDLPNRSLAEFKQRFGGVPAMIQYWDHGSAGGTGGRLSAAVRELGRAAISRMPLSLLPSIGNALYPHIV